MAQALILDCEALGAIVFATQRSVAARRARAILQVAYEEHALVRVPSPVLADVYRGGGRDAAVDRVLTHDPDDFRRLTADHPSIRVFAI